MTSGALVLLALLAILAATDRAWVPAVVFAAGGIGLLTSAVVESGRALGAMLRTLSVPGAGYPEGSDGAGSTA